MSYIYQLKKKYEYLTNIIYIIREYNIMKNIEHSLKIYDGYHIISYEYDFVKSKSYNNILLPKYILRVREIFLNNFYEPVYYFFLFLKKCYEYI